MANTRVLVTADELREIEDAIEKLLVPYVRRKAKKKVPEGVRGVRLLRYSMPEPDEADGTDP
jgi:hypothetical protein